MPNIQNIILEKMENNECDIYSKTNTNCTFYIQRFELFNTERLFSFAGLYSGSNPSLYLTLGCSWRGVDLKPRLINDLAVRLLLLVLLCT